MFLFKAVRILGSFSLMENWNAFKESLKCTRDRDEKQAGVLFLSVTCSQLSNPCSFFNFSLWLRRTIRSVRLLFGNNWEPTLPHDYKAYKKMQKTSSNRRKQANKVNLTEARNGPASLQLVGISPAAEGHGASAEDFPIGLLCQACCWHVCCHSLSGATHPQSASDSERPKGAAEKLRWWQAPLSPGKNHLWTRLTLLFAALLHVQLHLTAVPSWQNIKGGLLCC